MIRKLIIDLVELSIFLIQNLKKRYVFKSLKDVSLFSSIADYLKIK
jgi:hypothetical protein